MKIIQTSLVDNEYKLDKNPSNQEVVKECNSQINTLRELLRDFDTLVSYSHNAQFKRTEILMELIKSNEASKTKVEYLINKISNMLNDRLHKPMNHDLHLNSAAMSEGTPIYGDQWTNADTRQMTMRSDELKTGLQEPQMNTYRDNVI